MHLVQNWQQSWKWISMQATAVRGAAEGAFLTCLAVLNEQQREHIVAFVSAHINWVFAAMFAVTFVQGFGRLVQQQPPADAAK